MSLRPFKGRPRAFTLGPSAAPSNSVAPAITGNAYVGSTLTCSTGTWLNTPISGYSYQWKRGVTNVGTDQSTYVPVTGDIGSTITCTVTATNVIGSTSQVSNTTAAVIGTPVNTVAPAITGNAYVGSTLTCSTGTWTGGGLTYSYQWVRNPSTNVGTNQNTYVPVTGDIGSTIRCVVTATNAVGADQGASANTAAVIGAPVNTVLPAISGTAQVGQTLTSTTGTWTGGGSITYAYQWKSAGSNVGTNQNTYVPVVGDIGNTITVTVTATNAAGSGTPAVSSATSAVIAAPWTPATLGSALVGWWKADTLAGADNDPIATWPDASGNSRDGTTSGTARPLLRTSALNSLNVLEFDGVNDLFSLPNFMTAFTAGTVFWVVKLDAGTPPQLSKCGPPMSTGTSGAVNVYPYTDTLAYIDWGSTTRQGTTPNNTLLGNWHIAMFLSASANWRFFLNNSSVLTSGTNTVGFRSGPLIGSDTPSGGVFIDGRIAEIFMTNTSMSGADQALAYTYLNTKWALGL